MSEEKPKKKGHSVGLGKVVGLVVVVLFVGMILGGYLSFTVIGPELQKLHIDIGYLANSSNQNNNNNGNDNNSYNNNNNNGNNNNNDNGNQGGVNNNNPAPSSPTGSYGGSGQVDLTMQSNGNSLSGTLTANINCAVEQNGNNIQLSIDLTPTSVSGSLQQAIPVGGSDTVFNFVGTTSGSQFTANSQGNTGSGQNFDFNLSGSIDSNTLTFTMTSASDSQITVSTPQQIVTHNNA